jgi:hypothetical protein
MAKKEKEVNSQVAIPEQIWNRADTAIRKSELGSPFTQREKTTFPSEYAAGGGTFVGGLPTFPYGGRASTFLDADRNSSSYSGAISNDTMAQYERDAGTRMVNRYTVPTGDLLMRNPFGDRVSNTSYSNPRIRQNIEQDNYYNRPSDVTPSIGTSGVSREKVNSDYTKLSEQIVSPYGFAQTTLTEPQLQLRAQSIKQAQQDGTMPRTPEQQQALLAQMRTRGAAIGRDIAGFQENFFQAKREERDTVNDMVSQAMRSGYTAKEAKAMAQPYYRAQPSSIADIQRDAANYRAIGFDKMSGYMQDNVRGMFPSDMGARPAFGSGASVLPAGGGGGMPYEPIPMPSSTRVVGRRIGASDFGTRAGMETPSPYPSGDESRAKRAARRNQRQGTEYGSSGYNPIIPPELRG